MVGLEIEVARGTWMRLSHPRRLRGVVNHLICCAVEITLRWLYALYPIFGFVSGRNHGGWP
jgi:hypothetical protein